MKIVHALVTLAFYDAAASVINVQPGTNLQSAVNNANAGDELVLANGIYSSTTGSQVVYISKSITIRALNPRGAIINGLDQRRCIAIMSGTVVLEGLQVTLGVAGSSVSAPPTKAYWTSNREQTA